MAIDRLLRAGAVAALLIAILLIGEIAVYAARPRSETTVEDLRLLSDSWLAGPFLTRIGLQGRCARVGPGRWPC